MGRANVWVVVLAAGDGRRLSGLTQDPQGTSVPKQFCNFGRGSPMIRWAIERARGLVPLDRIVPIVARDHRRWWEPALVDVPAINVVVQPSNRGTAAGVLLPLLRILRRDPAATVVFLPSDHHVDDEAVLQGAIEHAIDAAVSGRLILVGITPEGPDTGYGWILPSRRGRGEVRVVERFVEKPELGLARRLETDGAVWNSFVFVVQAQQLLLDFGRTAGPLLDAFLKELVLGNHPGGLEALYETIPTRDFSRDVLERVPGRLRVVVAPPCGWSDLGTPERLRAFLAGLGASVESPA